jgi:catechol 1,2-dioxygenase
MSTTPTESAVAAETGAAATERFHADKSPYDAVRDTPPERVAAIATSVLDAVHAAIREHDVSYDEYNALKAWLIQVGADGEWPLFLDVFVEHVVEEVATAGREGSKGTIEGPFYVPGAPEQGADGTIPMRPDEPGVPLTWTGTITSTDGTPLDGGVVDLWHANDAGFYSQFSEGQPEWNLRGRFTVGEDGRFVIRTVQPSPYQIPTDGATGALIAAAGWHAWRPAHLHVKVTAPGHQDLTAQLYFPGDPHNADDIASAVKPELMLDPTARPDGAVSVDYGFALDPVD